LANVPVHPVTSSTVSLPLDSYRLTFQQQIVVDRAFTWLAGGCLKSYGLPGPTGLIGRVIPPEQADLSLVNVLSLRSAEKYGYNPPLTAQLNEVRKLESGGIAPGSGGVLMGTATTYGGKPVPPGGCMGKAAAELVGKVGPAFPLVRPPLPSNLPPKARSRLARLLGLGSAAAVAYRNLTSQGGLVGRLVLASDFQMQANPKLVAARARWHVCMLKAGFDYNAPEAARSDHRWALGPSSATPADRALEVRVASADAGCEAKVDYAGLEVALLTGYQDQLINTHVTALEAFKQAEQRLLANATAVLAGRKTT